jgi:hypothetical protein
VSIDRTTEGAQRRVFLHPSVGLWVDSGQMDARQKVAAVSKVRCLEHQLLEGGRIRRDLTKRAFDEMVSEINDLRSALGWLEIDFAGQLRRSHLHSVAPAH